MTREEAKKLLGESATEEQITALLEKFHQEQDDLKKQVTTLEADNKKLSNSNTELQEYKTKYTELEKNNMTKEQLLEAREKELVEKTKKTDLLNNSIKAKSIFIGAGITDDRSEELVNYIVKEDEAATLASANLLAQSFKVTEENAIKKTKEELLTSNIKPNPSNIMHDSTMTKENYFKFSQKEKKKIKQENNNSFYNLE